MRFEALAHCAFQVRDLDAALAFYRDGLGMREHFRITYSELLIQMASDASIGRPHDVDNATMEEFERCASQPWLVYLEVAPRQFLELFPTLRGEALPDPLESDAYSHLCLEVADIESAWHDASDHGLSPEPVQSGLDGSWQFWLTDPDGHRIEVMQYTSQSRQLRNSAPN